MQAIPRENNAVFPTKKRIIDGEKFTSFLSDMPFYEYEEVSVSNGHSVIFSSPVPQGDFHGRTGPALR